MQKDSDFLVKGPKQIISHLTDIIKHKCIISAHFGERNLSFLTTIIELDQKNKLLLMDCAPNDQLNKQLLESPKVLFRCEVDGIKASFSGKQIKTVKHEGQAAFAMPIPDAVFWMQRREYYRIKIPMSHDCSFCEIRFSTEYEDGTVNYETGRFRIGDLSIRGMSLLNTEAKLADKLIPEVEYLNCSMHLHDGSYDKVSLRILNNIEVRTGNNNANNQRIGCIFTHVPLEFESNIQRYMQDIERQQKFMAI